MRYIITIKKSDDQIYDRQILEFVKSEIRKNNSVVSGSLDELGILYVDSENPEKLKDITYFQSIEEDKNIEISPPNSEIQ